MIEVQIEGIEIFDQLKNSDKQLEKALYFAKNRALNTVKTELARGVPKKYDTKQKTIRDRTRVNKNTGEVSVKGSPIRLFKFRVTPISPRRQLVTASVKRAKKSLPHAFVQQMRNGTIGVFERVGKKQVSNKTTLLCICTTDGRGTRSLRRCYGKSLNCF